MTSGRPQMLVVEMTDWDGNERYAQYQTFLVEDEDAQYRLHLGQYSGDAGTSFDSHDNMRFSTSDRDNDMHGMLVVSLLTFINFNLVISKYSQTKAHLRLINVDSYKYCIHINLL